MRALIKNAGDAALVEAWRPPAGDSTGESDGDSDGESDAAMADGGEGKAGEGKSSAGAAPSRLGLSTVRSALIARLGASVASDNSTVAERALKHVTKNFLSFFWRIII